MQGLYVVGGGDCPSAGGTNLEQAMASAMLTEGSSPWEQGVGNPVSLGHFDSVRDPAASLAEFLGLRN